MLKQLDHVNIRTGNLAAMTEWYHRVLNMNTGPRPDFSFGGAWLYVGDQPVLHLVETSDTTGPDAATQFEHMAYRGEDYAQFVTHLRSSDVEFSEISVDDPVIAMTQVHVRDPDGNHIHIDFPLVKTAGKD